MTSTAALPPAGTETLAGAIEKAPVAVRVAVPFAVPVLLMVSWRWALALTATLQKSRLAGDAVNTGIAVTVPPTSTLARMPKFPGPTGVASISVKLTPLLPM